MEPPKAISIFDSAASPAVDVSLLAEYCRELIGGLPVECHEDLSEFVLETLAEEKREPFLDAAAEALARARVTDPGREPGAAPPPRVVVDFERRMLLKAPPRPVGVFYDGYRLSRAFGEMASASGPLEGHWIIVITDQLFGTLEPGDSRYHARVSIYGFPCVISTTGLLEAPAKPRAYYLGKSLGRDRAALDEEFAGSFLSREDARSTEALKSYVAQAIFYWLTGEPFCEDVSCRLFNAHWQEELLGPRRDGAKSLCARHESLLEKLRAEATDGTHISR